MPRMSRTKPPDPPRSQATAKTSGIGANLAPAPIRQVYFHEWRRVDVDTDPFGPIMPLVATDPGLPRRERKPHSSSLPAWRSRARLPGEPPRGTPVGDIVNPREDALRKAAREASKIELAKAAARQLRGRPKPAQPAHRQPPSRMLILSDVQLIPPRPPKEMNSAKLENKETATENRATAQEPPPVPNHQYASEASIADAVTRWPDRQQWPADLQEAVAKLRPATMPAGRRFRKHLTTSTGRSVYISIR